jgi:Ca2+-binding EF-hand superfamily protein
MKRNPTTQGGTLTKKKEEAFDPKKYEKNGLTEDEVLEIKEAFDLFDTDKSGAIDIDELRTALKNLGIDAKNQTLTNMLNDLDKNKSGQIDFEEFIDMMTAKISDRDTKEDLQKVFKLFLGDDEAATKITLKHLKRVARELNENISDEELQEMIVRADLNKDTGVDFEEFYTILTKKI